MSVYIGYVPKNDEKRRNSGIIWLMSSEVYIGVFIYTYSMFDWSLDDWFILLFVFRVFLNFEK